MSARDVVVRAAFVVAGFAGGVVAMLAFASSSHAPAATPIAAASPALLASEAACAPILAAPLARREAERPPPKCVPVAEAVHDAGPAPSATTTTPSVPPAPTPSKTRPEEQQRQIDAVNAALREIGRRGEVKSIDCTEDPCVVYATVAGPRLDYRELKGTRALAPFAQRTYYEGGQMLVDGDYQEHGDETFAIAFPSGSTSMSRDAMDHLRARTADGLAGFDPRPPKP